MRLTVYRGLPSDMEERYLVEDGLGRTGNQDPVHSYGAWHNLAGVQRPFVRAKEDPRSWMINIHFQTLLTVQKSKTLIRVSHCQKQ